MKKIIKKIFLTIVFLFVFTNNDINIIAESKTKLPIDISKMNIIEIQDKVDAGYLSYKDLVQSYLDRINTYDDKYNTIISINKEAINQAIKLDLELKTSGKRSLLHGIPIIIKDNIDYTLLPTTGGSTALKDSYPKTNSSVVQKLIDAGAIIIAKTNMSEFAFMASNSKSSYGHVYNAYNADYTTYGSSGGTAAGVALNFAVAGIGTDTNSSIRTPSSANNVIGFRPTFGSVEMSGIIPYDTERDIAGPITKNIIDNAIIMEIIDESDNEYVSNLKNSTLNGKKIGVLTQFIYSDSNSSIDTLYDSYDGIVNLMENSINILKNNGAEIINIDKFYSSYYENLVNSTLTHNLFCYDFNQYIKNTTGNIKSFQDLIDNGGYIQALSGYNYSCNTYSKNYQYFKDILAKKEEYKKYVLDIMDKYDVDALIYPTTKNKLLKISETSKKYVTATSYTIAPTTGFPSINVPIGFDEYNLPYGMEILSKSNNENILYDIAYSYEKLTNYYKVPEEASKLYDIPQSVDDLISYYEEVNVNKNLDKKVKEFFSNYNDLEDVNYDAIVLLEELKDDQKIINIEKISFKEIILLLSALFICFIIIIKIKKEKKRRKLLKEKLIKFRY